MSLVLTHSKIERDREASGRKKEKREKTRNFGGGENRLISLWRSIWKSRGRRKKKRVRMLQYPIERYLLTLKEYVHNRACPEASIAKGYLMEECLNFCTRYLKDVESKSNRPLRRKYRDDPEKGNCVLSEAMRIQIHRWVLFHTRAVTPFLKEHLTTIKQQFPDEDDHYVQRVHFDEFANWFKDHVITLQNTSDILLSEEIIALSSPPRPSATKVNSYTTNGYFFRVKSVDNKLSRQNSGVALQANTMSVGNKKDKNLRVDVLPYYGRLSKSPTLLISNMCCSGVIRCPRTMFEFLTSSGSNSSNSNGSSSQSSYRSTNPPPIPPPPPPPLPPPPPPPSAPSPPILPLPSLEAKAQSATIITRGHNKGIPEWNTRKNLLDVSEGYKHVYLRCCNTLWKDHKSKTKVNYFQKNRDNPNLSSLVPPHIIEKQWNELIAYWSSQDAKLIATRNSINREQRGPVHSTGRKHFAQLRYEMEQSGEQTDKMSVWKKARNQSNADVAQVIEEYDKKLLMEPEDQLELRAVKDRIFHELLGEDGHGYCRTYGSTVPRSLVYPQESMPSHNTNDLIQKITEEVTEKVKEAFTRKMQDQLDKLQARINFLESNEGQNRNSCGQVGTQIHNIICYNS
ncbi:uncharacterized protein LOC121049926 [Rosa chinensis]|uniref:uncharacterized protein LOC121049926 n=1 Tax=Rosa chinensis TaxID=74649 RepID=UPI001AD8E22B|nr:uncharacterized protein LOC121049926 [Rosa chinensis]